MKTFVVLLTVFCLMAFSAEAQIGWTANDFAKAGWRDTGVHPALSDKEKKLKVTATTYARDNWTQVVYSRLSAGDNLAKSVEVVFCRSKEQLTEVDKLNLLNGITSHGRWQASYKNRWRVASSELFAQYRPGAETMTVYLAAYHRDLDAADEDAGKGRETRPPPGGGGTHSLPPPKPTPKTTPKPTPPEVRPKGKMEH